MHWIMMGKGREAKLLCFETGVEISIEQVGKRYELKHKGIKEKTLSSHFLESEAVGKLEKVKDFLGIKFVF